MLKKVEKRFDEEGNEVRTDAMGKEYTVKYDLIGNELREYHIDYVPEPNRVK